MDVVEKEAYADSQCSRVLLVNLAIAVSYSFLVEGRESLQKVVPAKLVELHGECTCDFLVR